MVRVSGVEVLSRTYVHYTNQTSNCLPHNNSPKHQILENRPAGLRPTHSEPHGLDPSEEEEAPCEYSSSSKTPFRTSSTPKAADNFFLRGVLEGCQGCSLRILEEGHAVRELPGFRGGAQGAAFGVED